MRFGPQYLCVHHAPDNDSIMASLLHHRKIVVIACVLMRVRVCIYILAGALRLPATSVNIATELETSSDDVARLLLAGIISFVLFK